MLIEIGKNICKLRHERGLTQEQLAEIFGVSITAVSKWENSSSHPDITLLPKIAEYFDISVDVLLGYDMNKVSASIDERLKTAFNLFYSEMQRQEGLSIASELFSKYPGNIAIRTEYAMMKIASVCNMNHQNEKRKKTFADVKELLSSVNTASLTRAEHDNLLYVWYHYYLFTEEYGEVEKILEKLKPCKRGRNFDHCELSFYLKNKDNEKAEKLYQERIWRGLQSALTDGAYQLYHINTEQREKVIMYNDLQIELIHVVTKGMPSPLDDNLSGLYETNAFMYACLGDAEKSLSFFEKGVNAAIRLRTQAETEAGNTIPYFSLLDKDINIKDTRLRSGKYTPFKWALSSNERDEYSLIKDTAKFKELYQKIEEYGL